MDKHKHKESGNENHPQGTYETRDVDFNKLMVAGVGLIALVVVMIAGTWMISALLSGHSENPGAPPDVTVASAPNFPAPQLQPDPVLDLKHMRDHEDSVLTSYGWTDRKAGLVRVPINQAMNLLLERGLPVASPQGKGSERK
jgi:hypothetical protein